VEVCSPDDGAASPRAKVEAWLAHGCPVVVTIDPIARTVDVHRPGGPQPLQLAVGDLFAAEDLLPGFALPVAGLFAP
jgi:hypothetical protein